MDEIVVSINCTTYNHEKYIRDAIDSFLMQKTNFNFEILVHDDASTDKTREIITEYHTKYPDLIKPMYQTENQHSKGIRIAQFNLDRAKGKYIASCEGDDYWTDPYKLQKQVDFMEANPEYSLCGHTTKIIDSRNDFILGYFGDLGESREVDLTELMYNYTVHTSSMFFRADLWRVQDQMFVKNAFVGDYAFVLWLNEFGKTYLINEEMSIYRKYVEHSWSSKNTKLLQNNVNTCKNLVNLFQDYNVFTDGKHNSLINDVKNHYMNIIQDIEQQLVDMPYRLLMIGSTEDYHFLKSLENIYIFGTGQYGQKVNSYLSLMNENVRGFIDNNSGIIGDYLNDKLIYHINDVDKYANILICSSWYKEIYDQLKNSGYKNIFVMNHIN